MIKKKWTRKKYEKNQHSNTYEAKQDCLSIKKVITMDNKLIRRNLYKVLRRTGVPRKLINENAELQEELLVDDVDMTCFLFYLESKFDVNISNEELPSLRSVRSTIDYLTQRCA